MPFSNPTPSHFPGARASSPAPTFSHAHPALYIANPTTGSADVSSAAPRPHAHPANPSANTPFNEQQTTNDKPQATNNEPSPTSPSALALFLQVLHIAMVVVSAIAQRMDSDLHCLTLLQGCEAINCLYSIIRIQLTIDRHPERITPAELRRLAKASRYINRLARQKLDFSLFLPTDNPQSTDNEQQTTNNKQTSNPQSKGEDPVGLRDRNPQLTLPRLNLNGLPSTPICHSPGATLARTCQSLCRLLKLLPDLAYDPSGTVPTLDLANPAALSPIPGARASSPASTPTHANPATPSTNSPINEQQTTINEQQTTDHKPQIAANELFPIPPFSPAPT